MLSRRQNKTSASCRIGEIGEMTDENTKCVPGRGGSRLYAFKEINQDIRDVKNTQNE